jgi:hypothetical protein
MPSTTELASFWYAALAEPLGIWLRTPSPTRLKSSLYAVRARMKDPRLASLQVRTPPPGSIPGLDPTTHLWIVNPEGAEGVDPEPETEPPK